MYFSGTLKVRISSTSQPPIAPQSNPQPPHQSFPVFEPIIPTTSHSYSENEEEENEETELQVVEQRPVTRKRPWFVNVIGKQLCTKYYLIYYTYICLYNKLVTIIFSHSVDDQGKRITKQLRTNNVWHLPPNERIVVQWNNEGQPIADGGALLNRFLGSIARSSNSLPISYSSWKKIPKDYKEDVLKNTIQVNIVRT